MRLSKKIIFRSLVAVAALFASLVVGGIVALNSRALFPASEVCLSNNPTSAELAVLIVGDSWVTKGKLLPGFEEGFAVSSTKSLTVCSIGYPGRTSREIADGLKADYEFDASRLFGRTPDYVVSIVGINDAIQHSGVRGFVDGLQELSDFPSSHFLVMEIPHVDEDAYQPKRLLARLKHLIFLWGYDFGQEQALDKYRDTASQLGLQTIPIDDFAGSNEATPLGEDRIHLTPEGNVEFGVYLGRYVASFDIGQGGQ